MSEQPVKTYPTLGCCGIDCGLCPRYYTVGSSRCPGCCGPDFFTKHPSCSFITCCVKRKGLEACAQCDDFPCPKFDGWTEDREDVYDSFVTHRKAMPNLVLVQERGIEEFIRQQERRIELLKAMLLAFDDGRAKSFYCTVAALLPVADLEMSLDRARQQTGTVELGPDDMRTRAGVLRGLLDECATRRGIELRLRKKSKGQAGN